MQPEPFLVDIPQAQLDDLRSRLDQARFAPDFSNDDWTYGVDAGYLRELLEYWRSEYDWRAHEKAINAFPNFRVTIDDVPIHFIHAKGRGPKPMPLILSHGWPWCFWDYHELIGPLSDPAAHGGDERDAFDVIVPSLPGFAFSSPPGSVSMSAKVSFGHAKTMVSSPRHAPTPRLILLWRQTLRRRSGRNLRLMIRWLSSARLSI